MHSPCSGTITNCGSSSIPISRERLVGAAHALFIWYTSKVCEGHLHDIVPLILITSQDYRPVGWCETAVQRRGISACFGGQKQGEKTQSANHGTWKDAAAVAVHLLTILSRFILFSGPRQEWFNGMSHGLEFGNCTAPIQELHAALWPETSLTTIHQLRLRWRHLQHQCYWCFPHSYPERIRMHMHNICFNLPFLCFCRVWPRKI